MSKRKRNTITGFVAAVISAGLYWFMGVSIPPEVIAPPVSVPIGPELGAFPPADGSTLRVIRVIDGDTVELATPGDRMKVRIIGIDTPETVHPRKPVEVGGLEASARARVLLSHQVVVFRYDADPTHDRFDRYGRLLGYLELPDGRDYGLVMIEEGHAVAYTRFPFSRQEEYVEAERAARNGATGEN